ncbi:GATA transcription factor 15-like [Syzygium oleosum]|uniref:GATA transcription factor 15-like n=1 Tax=Syzygium oleosum TaxID=219896 RepID=UPI0011D27628|nr:GATA transcription factor 15-like [Syzygium oleosum]
MEMQDASDKGSESPGVASSEESHVTETKKTCADCGTTKTPLWRGGPAGPKSLCNACGIRSRKKRRDILGISKKPADDKKRKKINHSPSNNSNDDNRFGNSLKQRLLALLGREVMMQKRSASSSSSSSTSSLQRQRKKLGEEEQAAVLLMALSYGSVYA